MFDVWNFQSRCRFRINSVPPGRPSTSHCNKHRIDLFSTVYQGTRNARYGCFGPRFIENARRYCPRDRHQTSRWRSHNALSRLRTNTKPLCGFGFDGWLPEPQAYRSRFARHWQSGVLFVLEKNRRIRSMRPNAAHPNTFCESPSRCFFKRPFGISDDGEHRGAFTRGI